MNTQEIPINPHDYNEDFQEHLAALAETYVCTPNLFTRLIKLAYTLLIGFPWAYILVGYVERNSYLFIATVAVVLALAMMFGAFVDKMLRSAMYHTFMHTRHLLFMYDKGLKQEFVNHGLRYLRRHY